MSIQSDAFLAYIRGLNAIGSDQNVYIQKGSSIHMSILRYVEENMGDPITYVTEDKGIGESSNSTIALFGYYFNIINLL